MGHWKLSDLAAAAGAAIHFAPPADFVIEAVGTDSRAVPKAALFVALRGERFDGHAFVQAAITAGACAVLVDAAGAGVLGPLSVPALVVDDTLHALGDIAAMARRQMNKPVAAVTGSNGKTTTKELLAAALTPQGPVHKTAGNLNNLIGVPQTLLQWSAPAWAAVVEMGMNAPGEIARLTEIAAPNVGLITCVAAAHLEGLGTLEAVAQAKCELFAGLSHDATAILNTDDAVLTRASAAVLGKRRVVRFGSDKSCDVQLTHVTTHAGGLDMKLAIEGKPWPVTLPLVGRHNALNAAGAAATAWVMGVAPDAIARGLHDVRVPGARLRVLRDVGIGVCILDDCYNANPGSMRAAFATLKDVSGASRRVAALGDMFELGPTGPELHRSVGEAAAHSGVHALFAVGPSAVHTAAGARHGGITAEAYRDVDALQAALKTFLQPGDWLLVKGSRGMRMERLVEWVVGGSN